jgi:hypothetical protein
MTVTLVGGRAAKKIGFATHTPFVRRRPPLAISFHRQSARIPRPDSAISFGSKIAADVDPGYLRAAFANAISVEGCR